MQVVTEPGHESAASSRKIALDEQHKDTPLGAEGDRSAIDRGLDYLKSGENDRAIESFTEAIRLCLESTRAYFARACTHADKGDLSRALADCGKVIRLNPEHAEAYRLRASIYDGMGNWAKAERDLAKAKQIERQQK